jgi:hypothetical protein
MATNTTQKQAAKQFVQDWSGKGYEKGETSRFWIALLQNVYGIQDATKFIEFELPVKTILKEKGSDFIDGYIASTKVLIEQKGSHVDLNAKYRQSDGSELTPYQQARRYAAGLPLNMHPRWIVACNFTTFEVHDMEHPNDAPEVIHLADLEKEYHRLSFLVDDTNVHLKKELEVSIQAGEIVGVLYDKILAQYRNPDDPETQKALNKLCVRLVFCLYAEDAGIFGSKNMFHDYMAQFPAADFREKLIKLFRILDQKPEDRDPYEDEKLLEFPYVNGGMFAGDIEVPRINDEIRTLILQRASDDFDWSQISPTIFGAVFESTLNPETRRAGGMHYTSIENIHKVIDPLFLNDLKAELADIKATSVAKTKKDRAYAFQDKISKLKFFDPACGSGNFLTESYTSLRRLENEALRIIYGGDRVIGEMADPIKVSINQFYGIEINDFACSVAQTALWIAESQMMQATDEIVGFNLDPLPLKTYTNIHEGNALRMDWNVVIPAAELDYIMGNPPFIGHQWRSQSQMEDMDSVFEGWDKYGKLDYVAAWYKKAVDYIGQNPIYTAFVSTNSLVQGESVATLWKPLFEKYSVVIRFAYQPFVWNSEASEMAHVHCVIIGFTTCSSRRPRIIYDGEVPKAATNINGYLLDAPNVFIQNRGSVLIAGLPKMSKGSQPTDGGHLILSPDEREEIISKYPLSDSLIKRYISAEDFIQNKIRYCLWLKNVSPSSYRGITPVMERIENVAKMREKSPTASVRRDADIPMLFTQIRQPESVYLVVPEVSSERRKYIPIGYLTPDVIASNKLYLVPDASLFLFGVLESSTHMSWMRIVAGRLEMRYSYSPAVYNNFPWPQEVTDVQKAKIEQTAQAILDARALYPDSSLADLYDSLTMPPELRKAHRANDAAVLEAYGFPKDATESDIVAHLFKMYQALTRA